MWKYDIDEVYISNIKSLDTKYYRTDETSQYNVLFYKISLFSCTTSEYDKRIIRSLGKMKKEC